MNPDNKQLNEMSKKTEDWGKGYKSGCKDTKKKYEESVEYQIGVRVAEIINLLKDND